MSVDVVTVTFNSRWKCYNGGESAGFRPDVAAKLVDCGVARYLVVEPVIEDTPEAPPVEAHDFVAVKKPARVVVKK